MGEIKKVLSIRELPGREIHNSRLFVDLSENVHIHFREIRLMFGVEEFFEFTDIIRQSATDVKRYLKRHPDFEEQKVFDGLMVAGGLERQLAPLQKSPAPHVSKYFPNRLQIELQEEKVIDSIHIHYRDYRLVMNIETFREFAWGMREALDNLESLLETTPYNQDSHPFRRNVQTEEWRKKKITRVSRVRYRLKQFFKRLMGRR